MRIGFDDAIGVAPPSTVDLDRLIARRRRIRWLQRAGAAALAVVAVAALGTVTTLLRGDGSAPTAAPRATASAVPNLEKETLEQRTARFATVLPAILAERLPGVTLIGQLPVTPEHRGTGTVQRGAAEPPEIRYSWTATVSAPAGRAELMVLISNRLLVATGEVLDKISRQECRTVPRGLESCEVVTGPNGERIQRRVSDLDRSGPGQVLVGGVDAILPDRTSVTVTCPYGGSPGSTEPVLSLDQLTAVATDSRLAW